TNTSITNGACTSGCTVVDISPTIDVPTGWQTHQFVWTSDDDYFELVFSTDATRPLDGLVEMNIDNVCIQPYTESCKASFTFIEDECGDIELTNTSCGKDVSHTWTINGFTFTNQTISLAGPGTFNVTLSITTSDGCFDSVSQIITTTGLPDLTLTCPFSESVLTPLIDGICLYPYTFPSITTNNPSAITCFYNGSPVNAGDVLSLPLGLNSFSCTAIDMCENTAECAWEIFVDCEDDMVCDLEGNCEVVNSVNLSTGVDAFGNVIPSGSGQMDPFWKVINNTPVDASCTNGALSSLNGTPYVINYIAPNTTGWVNQTGAGIICPYDIGNNGGFGCNNITNANGNLVPYIFQRSFCVCEGDEFNINLTYEGDDQLYVELIDYSSSSVLVTGPTYIWTGTTTQTLNFSGFLPAGNYGIRAYLVNTFSTVLGFSLVGNITSLTGSNSIINNGECCQPQTINVRKILDNDCSESVTPGDGLGSGWQFHLKDISGTPILQTATTDINGELFFNNVQPGNYILEEVVMPGWTPLNPAGGSIAILVTNTSFNTFDFYNCPSPDVDCDSLMVMTKPYDLPCIDSSIITGLPCTFQFDPVCGCDGQTYSNACIAAESGITTFVPGECNGSNTPTVDDLCCHTFDIKNNWGTDIVELEVEMLTTDWIFNYVTLDPSLTFGSLPVLNNQFSVKGNGTTNVPIGLTTDAIKTCFSPAVSNPATPQMVEFRWVQQVNERDSFIVCRDTLLFECDTLPEKPCFTIEEDFIRCSNPDDPSHYEYCFTITNNSGFDVNKITLEDLPPGFSFLNNCTSSKTIVTIPDPILDGATSQQMCVGIKSSIPIITSRDICFKMGLISEDGDECCHSAKEICKTIDPCCDPCEDNFVVANPLDISDECCYSIDIHTACQKGYFTKIEAEIITPGVCFGSHVMGSLYSGFWTVSSTPTKINMAPLSGTIDQTSYINLFEFCLDKINLPAQANPQIVINWYAYDPINEEDFIACVDTITTECLPPDDNICLEVTEQELICIPDSMKYRYTFTITNTSLPAFTADKLHLEVKNDPVNYEPVPTGPIIPLTPPLQPGETRTISTCIAGSPFPAPYPDFIFGYRLQNMATGACCFESQCDTLSTECFQDTCCDLSYEEYCDYIGDLLDYEEEDCKFTFDFTELDLCDIVLIEVDGSPIGGVNVGESFCQEFNDFDEHIICFSFERWAEQNMFLPCLFKDTCITVNCMPPPSDSCYTCPSGTTQNDLIVNGDFELQNFGFTSDYALGPPNLTQGEYDVRSNFLGNTNWAAVDHTTGLPSGRFLVVDGPFPGAIWRQTVNVVSGQTYHFCGWFNNLVDPSLPEFFSPVIEVYVNGTLISTPLTLSQLPDLWVSYSGSWTSPTTGPVSIEIFNVSNNGFGDVAVDDLSFYSCDEKECCEDEDAFCDLVDLGWQINIKDCEVKVIADQFDSCHWMNNVSPDWGDGSILLPAISPANGCWTHTYDSPGVYTICATIFEGDDQGNFCWEKIICQDVEVECDTLPCDNVTADLTADPLNVDECCFIGSINNQYKPDYFKGIKVEVNLPATISQVQTLNGWTINQLNPSEAELYPPTVNIGIGQQDIFRICNANDGSAFTIDLSWLVADALGNCIEECEESFDVSCPASPGGCVEIVQDSINCDSMQYCFRVVNNTSPEIIVKSVEFIQVSPNGATLTPNPYSINPLAMGDTSEWICVDYANFGNDDVCFILVGHEADLPAGEPITWCCVDSTKYFIETDCDTLPCDNVTADLTADPLNVDECCFIGSINNQYDPNYFKGIKVEVNLPATISQVQTLNGWTINQLNPSEAELYPPAINIGIGQQDIFRICNANDGSAFTIDLSWLVVDSQGNCVEECEESFDVSCPGSPGGCVEIVQDSINCDSMQYCFRVVNNTSPEIIVKSVEFIQVSPNGATLTPNPYSINPLAMGDTSEWICVDYDNFGNDDVCFILVGHEADLPAGEPVTWCCVDSTKYFIDTDISPCCKPVSTACENILVNVVPHPVTGDLCCFEASIENNYCADYFKGIKIETNVQAVISQVQALNGWTINQINATEAEVYPPSTHIPLGLINVFNVCNDAQLNPFDFKVSWLIDDGNGNCLKVCEETLDLSCQGSGSPSCISVVQDSVDCNNDMYCFKIQNNTNPGFDVKSVDLISVTPGGTVLAPNPISIPTLGSGQTSDWICVNYSNVNVGDNVCYYVVAHDEDITQGTFPTQCCVTSDDTCFVVPDDLPCCKPISTACENILVNVVPHPVTGDLCCFEASVENNYCGEYFKGLKIETNVLSAISQVQALNGWTINQINATEAEVYPPSSYIPLGLINVFNVCNDAQLNPFDFKVSWLIDDGSGNCLKVCEEMIDLSCQGLPGGPSCIAVVQDSIDCENEMYCFKIQNNTNPGFDINSLDLISVTPSGTILSPVPISIPTLGAGQISDWICVTYANINVGDNLCYYVVAHDEDITQGVFPTQCCVSSDEYCAVIPQCPPPSLDCVQILDDSLSCIDGKYCFKIRNNTNPAFDINSLNLINAAPSTAGFNNLPIAIPTLGVGQTSDWICVDYFGNPDDTLCFDVVVHLQDITQGEEPTWCCSTLSTHCVPLEDCGNDCCQDMDAFEDLVDIGFDVNINQCQVTLTTSQYDSCHYLQVNGLDWGDGTVTPDTLISANGSWTHDFSASGDYEICLTVFEGDNGQLPCWESTYCMDIQVTCIQPTPCDNLNLVLPNGLTPNGDGLNDRLVIQNLDDCSPLNIDIYNRWGQKVYSSIDYKNDWEGFSSVNEMLPSGTYFIVTGYNNSDGDKIRSYIDIRR
ncbi:MAG: gliding motility-associated C-terminal domain-containing protein, partial [Bacteroidia bacterium]|nr:gliding motility-associated C-terminal domain-containing protein [Bacteroidia bacterium]